MRALAATILLLSLLANLAPFEPETIGLLRGSALETLCCGVRP